MILLALLPIAAVGLRRSRLVVGAVLAALDALGGALASDVPLADARPGDTQRDFFGPVLDSVRQGVLDFYETQLPVRPPRLPRHAHGRPARDLRLHGRHRHARDGAAAGGRGPRRSSWPSPGRRRSTRAPIRCAGVLALLGRPRDPLPAPAGGARARRPARRESWRPCSSCSRRRLHVGRRRQARLPLLADLGSVRPADRAGLGLLRVAGELRRDQVSGEADDGDEGEGARARSARSTGGRRRSTTTRARSGTRSSSWARPTQREQIDASGPAPPGGRPRRGRLGAPGLHHRGAARHAPARLGAARALAARGRRRPSPTRTGTSSSFRTRSGATSATPSGATSRGRTRAS